MPSKAKTSPIEIERGPLEQEIYSRVGPATVLVETSSAVGGSHGSGVLIDPQGWLLTNSHCMELATTDPETGAKYANIHLGKFQGGAMQMAGGPIQAVVYKDSPEKDLALLKLKHLPTGRLASVQLASTAPQVAGNCIALGHPVAGMPWTVRACGITGIGDWPHDRMETVIESIQTTSDVERARIREQLAMMPSRKVLVSSCGLNSGDSGGPLVDESGRLIALNFAVPRVEEKVFGYHIHLDELQNFVKDRPTSPLLNIPDPWPAAAFMDTLDLDHNGKVETLAFAIDPNEAPTGVLIDVDEDSDLASLAMRLSKGDTAAWDFEVGLQPGVEIRTFYDQNNDGSLDLVLVDSNQDGKAEVAFERKMEWAAKAGLDRNILDPSFLAPSMSTKFRTVVEALFQQPTARR